MNIDEVRQRVWQIRDALHGALVERDDAIECVMLGFVSQEHVVLEGPPGTAKSLLSDALMQCIDGGSYVRRLLHKFVTADELLGPMDLAHFKSHNAFRRVLTGGAADAHGLFLDEIFKANGALLNTLLTLLEERQFADQSGTHQVPLRMAVSASNEFPQEDVLGALYDRFLYRDRVNYIDARDSKRKLLAAKAGLAKAAQGFAPPCKITIEEWDAIAADVDRVTIPEAIVEQLLDFQDALKVDGIVMSDRRLVKVLRALKAAAWLDGETEAGVDHLQVLRFTAWDTPSERETVIANCRALDRSATRETLDDIDAAMRSFRELPRNPEERNSEIGKVMSRIVAAGKRAKAAREEGRFSKRGAAKVDRRMAELRDVHQKLMGEVRL